jgi:outer membrane protein
MQLMNITGNTEIEPEYGEYSVLTEYIPLRDQLFEIYIAQSPYFQSFESQLKASVKNLAVIRSGVFPSLSAGGSVSTGYYETDKDNLGNVIGLSKQFKNNISQYLGASLSIPVFSRWSNRSEMKQAKLEVELAKARLDSKRQQLYFEVTSTLNELEALKKEYLQYEKQKEVDLLAYQTAEKKIEQGLISVIDFYVVKNRYATTNSQVLRAKLQLEMKRKILDFYMGKRFWEPAPSDLPVKKGSEKQ